MWKFQSKPKRSARKVDLNSPQRLEKKRGHKRKGKKNQEKERVRTHLISIRCYIPKASGHKMRNFGCLLFTQKIQKLRSDCKWERLRPFCLDQTESFRNKRYVLKRSLNLPTENIRRQSMPLFCNSSPAPN